jgi:hypothetical protein
LFYKENRVNFVKHSAGQEQQFALSPSFYRYFPHYDSFSGFFPFQIIIEDEYRKKEKRRTARLLIPDCETKNH